MKGLAAVLVEEGLVSREAVDEAQAVVDAGGRTLAIELVEGGHVDERALVQVIANRTGHGTVDLSETEPDPTAVAAIPEKLARRYAALPIRWEDGALVVAMADPGNVFALDDLRAIARAEIRPVVTTVEDVLEAITRAHRMSTEIEQIADDLSIDETPIDELGLTAVTEEPPIVKFVNLLITQAVNDGASDIHIEPAERDVRIRYRIDGVLHEVMRSPRSTHAGVVSRLKIMAEVDIAERRIPQDGRIGLNVGGKPIDLRFSTLPTVYGEKAVMRILDKSSVLLELGDLGFSEENLARYRESYLKPYGMILATGPTGSGKSTTLYATLNVVNTPDVNIVTVEDPVEYRLAGVNQVQVNRKAGLTFASALRSILRQDPDDVLIGEMRDYETAQIGVEAALTGHLVLSTLHTNDAPSAITRLTEMGVEPFLVGSATDAILAQRLCRRVCSRCVDHAQLDEEAYLEAGFSEETAAQRPKVPVAVGCKACSSTGYRGRLAVHEVMTVTEEIERLCVARASSEEIGRVAVEQGMRRLRDDGLDKVLQGLTTIEEIGRVIV